MMSVTTWKNSESLHTATETRNFWKRLQADGTSGSSERSRRTQGQEHKQDDGEDRTLAVGRSTSNDATGNVIHQSLNDRNVDISRLDESSTKETRRKCERQTNLGRSASFLTRGTQLKINDAKQAFVRTNVFEQARKKLQEYGHLTLSGVSGEGKTTTALMLADHFQQRGYTILFQDTIDNFDIDNFVNTTTRTFIIFDDIFGTVGTPVNIGQVRTLLNRLALYMKQSKNQSGDLIDSNEEFLEESSNNQTAKRKRQKHRKKNLMVVFTSRSYILEETLRSLQDHVNNLFRKESTMDLTKKGKFNYSDLERRQILMNMKETFDHELDESVDIDNICQVTQQMFGFPLICKLYFQNANFQKDASDFFANPLFYLRRELKEIIESRVTKPGRAAALILPLLCDGTVNLAHFELRRSKHMDDIFKAIKELVPNVSLAEICQSARTFSGTFLHSKKDVVTFTHSSIYDACACALYDVCPSFVLKHCSLKFLKERVQHQVVENTSIDDHLHYIYLSESYHAIVVMRLADGIQHGEIELTFSHSVLRRPDVVDLLLGEMDDNILTSSDSDSNILYWAVHSGSVYLIDQLLQNFEGLSSEKNIGNAIVAASLTGAADILRFLKGKFSENFTSKIINHCLLLAAANNKHKAVDFLVNIGAVGDACDENGQNILHISCRNDSYDIVATVVPILERHNTSILRSVDNQGYNPIMIAAMNGNKHIFAKLFDSIYIDFQQEDIYGDSLIHHACKGGNISIVKQCLPKFDVNARGNGDWTPVMIAASIGNKGLFDLLVENKADLNLLDDDDNCLLHHASIGGNKLIIERLLPLFGINIKGVHGATPMTIAVGLRNAEAFDFLLSKKPDLSMKMKGGNTLMHLACQCGSTAFVKRLLPFFDINIKGEHGWTPIMTAAVKGNEHVFHFLIDEGADLSITDKYQDNILHLAAQGGNTAIVEYLLSKFDVNCLGAHRWTPIMKAVICNHKNVFYLLFEKSDLKHVDAFGDSLLHFACETGNTEIVKRLLPSIDVNEKGKQGWTPIMDAAVNGNSDVFHLLLDNNADTSQQTYEGDTLLHLACHGGNKDIMSCLLSAHNRDKRDHNGHTPVMISALNGHEELFSYIMKESPDINVKDRCGDQLLHFACMGGSDVIVSDLLSIFETDTNKAENDPAVHRGPVFSRKSKECHREKNEELAIDKKGKDGLSPIMVAALHGHKNIFDLLMGKNAKTSLVDVSGKSLIHLACIGGNVAIVRQVITPANVNVKDVNGWTPVMTAAAHGHKRVFELLVRCKADLNHVSFNDESISTLARKGGNAKIVKILESQPGKK